MRRRSSKSNVKCIGSTGELPLKLLDLRIREESRIPSVAVKCVEIGKNTGGEGALLDQN